MRTWNWLILAAGVALVAGCYETDEQYTLNPDGSGKVTIDAKITPMNLYGGQGKADPATMAKRTAKDLLEKSEGVTAWKDVSFEPDKDGRIHFRGTAYFRNLDKLKFYNNHWLFKYAWQAKDGTGVLSLKMYADGKAPVEKPEPPTEDEIKAQIEQTRVQCLQSKPTMLLALGGVRTTARFKLPGTAGEAAGFAKDAAPEVVSLSISGGQILAAVDQVLADEALMHDLLAKGYKPIIGLPPEALWLKVFGTKAMPQVTVASTKPQFDFEAEVAAAKKAYPALLEKTALAADLAQPAPEGTGLMAVVVAGVRMNLFDPNEWVELDGAHVMRSAERPSYNLTLAGKFWGPVHATIGGVVDKAITDNGEDLLHGQRDSFYPNMRSNFREGKEQDGRVVTWDIALTMPSDKAKTIKELSGKLVYKVIGKKRTVNLGITDFKDGAKGTEYSAVIESIKNGEGINNNQKTLKLSLSNLPDIVGEFRLYDEDGSRIQVQGPVTGGPNNPRTFSFFKSGELPAKGRIELDVYDEVKTLEAPFKLENVPLFSMPAKSKE